MNAASLYNTSPPPKRMIVALWLIVIALVAIGMYAAAGGRVSPDARAANPATVTVNASVGSSMDVTLGSCGSGTIAQTISLGAVSYSANCVVTFGASNDATTRLGIMDDDAGAPANFFDAGAGSIADTAASCAAMPTAADQAGVHLIGRSANVNISGTWCATQGTDNTNDQVRAMPTADTNVCESLVAAGNGVNKTCTFEWIIAEAGSDLAVGTYTGVARFTATDY